MIEPGRYIGEDGIVRLWDGKQFHTLLTPEQLPSAQTKKTSPARPFPAVVSLLLFVVSIGSLAWAFGILSSLVAHELYSSANSIRAVYGVADAMSNDPCELNSLADALGKERTSGDSDCFEEFSIPVGSVPDPFSLSAGLFLIGSVALFLYLWDRRRARRLNS